MQAQNTYNRSMAATVILTVLGLLITAAVGSTAHKAHPTAPTIAKEVIR